MPDRSFPLNNRIASLRGDYSSSSGHGCGMCARIRSRARGFPRSHFRCEASRGCTEPRTNLRCAPVGGGCRAAPLTPLRPINSFTDGLTGSEVVNSNPAPQPRAYSSRAERLLSLFVYWLGIVVRCEHGRLGIFAHLPLACCRSILSH